MSETSKSSSCETAQLDISFACIAHKSEAHHVMQMLATIPAGAEVVVLWNEQGDNIGVMERKTVTLQNGTVVRYYETEWRKLHFANLRNLCIDLCSREWVMWIDADDRLLPHQHSWFSELDIYPPGVGGLVCGCVGVQPKHQQGSNDVMRYHTPTARVFRNYKGFIFQGAAHEQIGWSIEKQGFSIGQCSLIIHHVGYEVDADAMTSKLKRNVRGLAHEIANCTDDEKLIFWTQMIHRDSQSFMYYITKDNQHVSQ